MIDNMLVFLAAKFATIYHNGQTRGANSTPYVYHCFDVAGRLVEAGIDVPQVIAASILHDVVEDTDATIELVSSTFGGDVGKLVMDLTLPETHRKVPKKIEWQVRQMGLMSDFGRAIKVADKTSNVADLRIDPPGWGKKAVLGYVVDSKQVVDAARARLTLNSLPGLLKLLDRFDEEYEISTKGLR